MVLSQELTNTSTNSQTHLDEPNIVKLNQQRNYKREDRTELNHKQMYRTEFRKPKHRCWKIKNSRTKNAQEHKTTRVIEREERKEKRMLMKMEEGWMISPLEVWMLLDECASRHLRKPWSFKIRLE